MDFHIQNIGRTLVAWSPVSVDELREQAAVWFSIKNEMTCM